MRLEPPQAHKAQQGAIFNCVNVAGYDGCRCYGLILTARCDLEHKKQSVINYLPVVPFRDWAARSLVYLLSKRSYAEHGQEISKQLDHKGISQRIRESFPLEDIVSREFSGKEQTALSERLRKFRLAQDILSLKGEYTPRANEIIREAGKKGDRIVEELIQQKLSEYYFLDAVDMYEPAGEGYVILLRSMQAYPSELMDRVIEGFDADDFREFENLGESPIFSHEPICMVTGVLRSPDIEHLAQHFANLFVRIGLEDQSPIIILRHVEALQLV